MTGEERELENALINAIVSRVSERPDFMTDVIRGMTSGCEQAVRKADDRARDMETLASVLYGMAESKGRVTSKTKEYFESLAQSKIKAHYPKLWVPWENVLKNP